MFDERSKGAPKTARVVKNVYTRDQSNKALVALMKVQEATASAQAASNVQPAKTVVAQQGDGAAPASSTNVATAQ
jgi:hypothetical protein